jgi:glycosyltransferase involved in cell wall biosynthesis
MAGSESTALRFVKTDRGVHGDPLVSIAIPAYSPRFFGASLDSALAQTYGAIEIVVCDDSPGSEIEAVAHERTARFPVRYKRNPVRLGPRGNFTRCLEAARGEFVKLLCDDDLLEPECIASLLDAFRRAPDIALATSLRRRIDERGTQLEDQPATVPIVAEDSIVAGPTLANAMIMAGLNTVGEPSTTLFRRADLLEQAPGYFCFGDEPGHGIIDMVSWAALLLKGDAVYLNRRLSSFRIHEGQRQHDPAKAARNAASIRSLQAAWLELGLDRRLRPDELLVKPFPLDNGADWRAQPVLGFAARRIAAG